MVVVPLNSSPHNVLTSGITVFYFAGYVGNSTLANSLLWVNILATIYWKQKKYLNAIIFLQFVGKKIHA